MHINERKEHMIETIIKNTANQVPLGYKVKAIRNALQNTAITPQTVYMEFFSEQKIIYRVTASQIEIFDEKISTYGIEAVDYKTGESEIIADFSENINDAAAFAESLVKCGTKPKQIYEKAIGFLKENIRI